MTALAAADSGAVAADWGPAASVETLRLRADMLAALREFFAVRDVLEVETPYLSAAGTTDPNIGSLIVAGSAARYLHTSPEFPMKRLLAAGAGDIYQVCRVFRAGEMGRRHNPEFSMLEWYRLGFDHHRLMREVAELLVSMVGEARPLAAPEFMSYREAYLRHTGLDPFEARAEDWHERLHDAGIGIGPADTMSRDGWLDLAGSELVHPRLGQGRVTFLYDFPPSQAALARVRLGPMPVAERFEAFVDGMELANGFHELADAGEQAARFGRERARRAEMGLPDVHADERLIAALEAGLPDCAGVAVGLDRVLMLRAGVDNIAAVLAFPADRA